MFDRGIIICTRGSLELLVTINIVPKSLSEQVKSHLYYSIFTQCSMLEMLDHSVAGFHYENKKNKKEK